jgi:translation initiation factor 2B subunit (eIF-2B alpha/beta/delta family)
MSTPGRSLWVSRRVRIAKSHALVFKSQLLLLRVANHFYRRTRTTEDLKRVEHVRSELHNTEAALRRTGQDEFSLENGDFWLQMYADLIDCSTASLARMRSAMSSREAADRFETATDVQMLEELIAQWTSRMQLIRQNIADHGHTRV